MSVGAVFYRGPSMLTGDPVVGILSGLEGESNNPKTGPMVQAWIIRPDLPPQDAKRANLDDAICGDCKLRGRDGVDSGCYVAPWLGPNRVYRALADGNYIDATWREAQALVEGRGIRLGAYGDPAAIPFEVWRALLAQAGSWIGYTHAWKVCDQRFKSICMASVDSVDEFHAAHLVGWRTFRIRLESDALLTARARQRGGRSTPLEIVCPASDEAGHRVTCQECRLCQGTAKPARSIAIMAHGKPSSLRMFRRVPLAGIGA